MLNLALLPLNVFLMAWLAWQYHRKQLTSERRPFWPALSAKVVGGIALGCLYFFHYGVGDTLSFWQDGNHLAAFFRESPGQVISFLWDDSTVPGMAAALQQQAPRSLFFVKICGFLSLISGGNYWLMATWLSLASFVGAWFLYTRMIRAFPEARPAAAIALLFVPSVVFWSSGLIKESLGLAALFVLTAGTLSMVRRQSVSWMEWLGMVLSLWVGWNLKYYWVGIFLPVVMPVITVALITRRQERLIRYEVFMWLVFFAAFLLLATNIHPNFYASRFLEVIYHNNLEFTRMSDPPRIVQYLNLEPSAASVIMNAPAALLAGLFRPFFWEAFNPLSWVAALENLILLVLVLQAIVSCGKLFRSPHRVLLLSAVVYVLMLLTFLALSTPNFGTLSRYRIGALPVLVLLCLLPATPLGKWLADRRWFG